LSHQVTIQLRSYCQSKCLKSCPPIFTQVAAVHATWSIALLMTRWCRSHHWTSSHFDGKFFYKSKS